MTPTPELKRLAEEATPGPWGAGPQDEFGDFSVSPEGDCAVAAVIQNGWREPAQTKANAAYIAAANPARVLHLIEENERLREAVKPFAAFAEFEAAVLEQAPDARPAPDDSVFKHWDDAFDMKGPKLTYGDLRRARQALGGQSHE